jgi:hypothetical protein
VLRASNLPCQHGHVARRRKMLLLSLCGLIAVVTVCFFCLREREPSYNGRTLSEWLPLYGQYVTDAGKMSNLETQRRAGDAIRSIGPKACPFLVNWIQYKRPDWENNVAAFGERWRIVHFLKTLVDHRDQAARRRIHNACEAFRALGPAGAGAIPELEKLAMFSSREALLALAYIGEAAIPAVTNVVFQATTYADYDYYEITALRILNANGTPIVSTMQKCLVDKDARVVGKAAKLLFQMKVDSTVVLPPITRLLASTNVSDRLIAIEALNEFGIYAKTAGPAIKHALLDSNAIVREYATNALSRIPPEPVTNDGARNN